MKQNPLNTMPNNEAAIRKTISSGSNTHAGLLAGKNCNISRMEM